MTCVSAGLFGWPTITHSIATAATGLAVASEDPISSRANGNRARVRMIPLRPEERAFYPNPARLGIVPVPSRSCTRIASRVVGVARRDLPEAIVGHIERARRRRIGQPRGERAIAPAAVVHAARIEAAQPRRYVES